MIKSFNTSPIVAKFDSVCDVIKRSIKTILLDSILSILIVIASIRNFLFGSGYYVYSDVT